MTEDPTGQVENGFIRLKGSLTAVELCKAQHYELHRNSKVTASIIYLATETQETGKGFYCLPIRHFIYKEPWVAGLILRLSAQGGETYERCGVFNASGKREFQLLGWSCVIKRWKGSILRSTHGALGRIIRVHGSWFSASHQQIITWSEHTQLVNSNATLFRDTSHLPRLYPYGSQACSMLLRPRSRERMAVMLC